MKGIIMKIGQKVTVPGGFVGNIVSIVMEPSACLYRVSFFNEIAGSHQSVEFYDFELEASETSIGFKSKGE